MADEDVIVTITMLGREMQLRTMNEGQLLIMSRLGERAQKQLNSSANMGAATSAYSNFMTKLMDMIDTLFVSDEDRQAVEDAMIRRELALADLMTIALGGKRSEDLLPDDADPPAPKKKAAKGTKKTANPRRATR